VLSELHSERFVDSAPAHVWATLLDEGRYLASQRTIYRLLASEHGEVRERRAQLRHPPYAAPELLAACLMSQFVRAVPGSFAPCVRLH
jgi:putative transposase